MRKPERPEDTSPTYSLFAERAWEYMDYLEAELLRCRAEALEEAAGMVNNMAKDLEKRCFGNDIEYVRADIHEAELSRLREALDGALRSFKLTQNPNDYSSTHWSRRAQAVLQEVNHDA